MCPSSPYEHKVCIHGKSYNLVRCWVVEDLIHSPHLSQNCTKGQHVTQHIHPRVQLHGKMPKSMCHFDSKRTCTSCSNELLSYAVLTMQLMWFAVSLVVYSSWTNAEKYISRQPAIMKVFSFGLESCTALRKMILHACMNTVQSLNNYIIIKVLP